MKLRPEDLKWRGTALPLRTRSTGRRYYVTVHDARGKRLAGPLREESARDLMSRIEVASGAQERVCLAPYCGETFISEHRGHRLCDKCRRDPLRFAGRSSHPRRLGPVYDP